MTIEACAFCGGKGAFRADASVLVCQSCALRVADLANDPSADFWASSPSPRPRPSTPPSAGEAVDTERLFEEFKAGVAKQIDDRDAESHLNLAEAYREMGLFLDARREAGIAVAVRSSARTTEQALRLLLTPPLLRSEAWTRLRERLRRRPN